MVYLTGAGPGDIDLLTVKALKIVKKADIIIYDRLVNIALLEYAKKDVVLVYVGKEKDNHKVPQDEINEIIYQASLKYEHVVRLKGGDPFVFGRGAEEALYLVQRNQKFEIIPGITSAISVPAYAGIPVTHRGITPSFRVVTGHTKSSNDVANINWSSFVENETIVFLMGLHNIQLIVNKLLDIGKPPSYPCAIITDGTTSKQQVLVGTLETIVQLSKKAKSPSIIIVGEVVNLRKELNWFK